MNVGANRGIQTQHSGCPGFVDPSAENSVRVYASVPVTLTPSWGSHGIRRWNRTLTVRVSGIAPAEGD